MERAESPGAWIVGFRPEQDMPEFRMNQAVDHMAFDDQARADARADRHIHTAVQTLRRAELPLCQRRGVHVRINDGGNVQFVPHGRQQGLHAPAGLRGLRDPAVGLGSRVQIYRPEGSDAQGNDPLVPEPVDHRGNGLLRRFRGDTYLLQQLVVLISDRQHHLGPAGFQCSESHCVSPPCSASRYFIYLRASLNCSFRVSRWIFPCGSNPVASKVKSPR